MKIFLSVAADAALRAFSAACCSGVRRPGDVAPQCGHVGASAATGLRHSRHVVIAIACLRRLPISRRALACQNSASTWNSVSYGPGS